MSYVIVCLTQNKGWQMVPDCIDGKLQSYPAEFATRKEAQDTAAALYLIEGKYRIEKLEPSS